MNDKRILVLIALALVAILGVLVYQMTEKTPAEKMADSISEAAEEVGDAAQDAVNGN